jgi:hypothetical protein
MTEMAWRYIFSREDNSQYHIHLFKNVSMLRAAEASFPWSAIIFSLSGSRSSRAESLLFVHEMARSDRKSKRLFWLIMKVKCA